VLDGGVEAVRIADIYINFELKGSGIIDLENGVRASGNCTIDSAATAILCEFPGELAMETVALRNLSHGKPKAALEQAQTSISNSADSIRESLTHHVHIHFRIASSRALSFRNRVN
jgi:hypothetical protein